MATNTFKIKVITPEEIAYEGETSSLIVPGATGYLGVLKDHAPLVTPLKAGEVSLRLPNREEKTFTIDQGFLEVSQNQAVLLVEKISDLS